MTGSKYQNDPRVVMTLDAGGTNFVFSAICGNKEVVEPVAMKSEPNDIDRCLDSLYEGFSKVKQQLDEEPVAISFAFPGPADYEHGVIGGGLPNFPAFRSGVALGPYLNHRFGIPVFINNDGNMFAYGEALAGALPAVNAMLEAKGSTKRYRNLIGITLGTGFGAGVVIDNVLLKGDNGCGGDVWLMRNKRYPDMIAEESVSIRAVRRVYAELSGTTDETLTPKDIFDIAEGARPGNQAAAQKSFEQLGEMCGAAIANALNIVDGIVVIGGGLAGASKYILPAVVSELGSRLGTFGGDEFACTQMEVLNLTDSADCERFVVSTEQLMPVQGSDESVAFDLGKRTGITVSTLGTSRAIALGAYAYALNELDKTAQS
ncbi:MAG: ROK family protein [Muribaculaceae bacterium]